MKVISIILVLVFLAGCGNGNAAMDQALSIRSRLLKSGCEFSTSITADYQDRTHTFKLQCTVDPEGNVQFSVIAPESISGITGNITAAGGQLTFDEHILIFPVLSEGLLSPVCAPWVFVTAIRSGYIGGVGTYGDGLRIVVDDSYEDNTLKLLICTDSNYIPCQTEIFWNGQRILTMTVENFVYL